MRNFQPIHPKALEDLEFNEILNSIQEYAYSDEAKQRILQITPSIYREEINKKLDLTNEYLSSLESENPFPHHFVPPFNNALKILSIENAFIEPDKLLIIANAVDILNELKRFFIKHAQYFPRLLEEIESLKIQPEISKLIRKIINQYGDLKDEASPELKKIRKNIYSLQQDILQHFSQEKRKYDKLGYLSDIKESILENRNVLAVSAAYRKKVKGSILGTSKTGSIVFIEPEAINALQKQLFSLRYDEKQEIIRILKELTENLRPYESVLFQYNEYLINLETIAAKAKFALILEAIRPQITQEKQLKLVEAYHPILKLTNQDLGLPVIPQEINLNEKQRIIIISGPNAGGKSISLKTAGLLQVMAQSGILIPVNENTKLPVFTNILTDIGDNQSIENQLSTYSYRLKNMRNFLRKINENTLFLIDEFGTGSDPDLGGALAEAFLEEFYKKKAFGIITTHYNNLKLIADKYPEIVNAHMEFDVTKLQPTYRLHIGQAGSSFTFEVAQKIGIPYSIINKAKKKVSRNKVKFDQTLVKMQREIKKLKEMQEKYEKEKLKLEKEYKDQTTLNKDLLKKLNRFNKLYQMENDILQAGEKLNKLFEEYFKHQNAKKLTSQVFKWAEIEKNKKFPQLDKTKRVSKNEKKSFSQKKKMKKELKEEVQAEIHEKDVKKELENIEIKTMDFVPQLNDQVRIKGSQSNAIIEKLEKNKAQLNYGKFRAWAPIQELELVLRK